MGVRMPTLFIGHGNPMNAITETVYSKAWSEIGRSLPRPRAILSVSAHWYINSSSVTTMASPRTIHDFGGFPRELYDVSYPAPGSPELAWRVRDLLSPNRVELDEEWGLDHGTWSILVHLFPDADVPVVQLSIDMRQPASFHYEVGQLLAPLREAGVLILGSGNIVHNLHAYAWGNPDAQPYDWALQFEEQVMENILNKDSSKLIAYSEFGRQAALSVPSPDHYLPLLYILGACGESGEVSFPVTGIEGGSLSMLAVQLG